MMWEIFGMNTGPHRASPRNKNERYKGTTFLISPRFLSPVAILSLGYFPSTIRMVIGFYFLYKTISGLHFQILLAIDRVINEFSQILQNLCFYMKFVSPSITLSHVI